MDVTLREGITLPRRHAVQRRRGDPQPAGRRHRPARLRRPHRRRQGAQRRRPVEDGAEDREGRRPHVHDLHRQERRPEPAGAVGGPSRLPRRPVGPDGLADVARRGRRRPDEGGPAGRHRAVHLRELRPARPPRRHPQPRLLDDRRPGQPAAVPRLDRVPRDRGLRDRGERAARAATSTSSPRRRRGSSPTSATAAGSPCSTRASSARPTTSSSTCPRTTPSPTSGCAARCRWRSTGRSSSTPSAAASSSRPTGRSRPASRATSRTTGWSMEQDLEAAAALIEEYEAETGQQVEFQLGHTPNRVNDESAELLLGWWSEIGVDASDQQVPQDQFITWRCSATRRSRLPLAQPRRRQRRPAVLLVALGRARTPTASCR